MRALGGRGSKTITATPRQLESMIRLSQVLFLLIHIGVAKIVLLPMHCIGVWSYAA